MSSPLTILLPRSKSLVIRCLLINYYRTKTLLPIYESDPNDIKIVYNALKIIDLQRKSSSQEKEQIIDVQDCGAAYRFLMPQLATTKGKWFLTGTPRLLQRPILPLVDFLNEHGAKIMKSPLGWQIEGETLEINSFNIDTSQTSQYASALLMCGARNSLEEIESPYFKMTQTLLINNKLAEEAPYFSDWSSAIFWLANAILVSDAHYFLKNLYFDGLQGDAGIASWFSKWGLSFSEKEDGIEVKHTQSMNIPKQTIDVQNTPDIAMILAVLSVCYPFELIISGLKNLNLKESNRLDIMRSELSRFTKIKKYSTDTMTIAKRVKKLPMQIYFNSYNDHRFVMAWALFRNFGKVVIKDAECVKKSYPDFEAYL